MAITTIEEVKEHLRITQSDEDNVLAVYMGAADSWISNFLNLENVPVEDDIKSAALLIVGDLYQNREATTDMQKYENATVKSLLYPYRQGIGI